MTDRTVPTPPNVARLATRDRALTLNDTAVIGIFGPETDLRALVRDRGGRIRRMGPGQRLDGGRIRAIDAAGILIEGGGDLRRLDLP